MYSVFSLSLYLYISYQFFVVVVATIDHFTVVSLVTCSLNGSEAGVDLVLIQTSLLLLYKSSCFYANQFAFT